MLRSLPAVAALVALAASCNDNAPKTVQGGKFGGKPYTIRNIHGWEEQSGPKEVDRVWLSPAEGPRDRFRENINVVLEEIPPGVTEEKYLRISAENFKRLMNAEGDVTYEKTQVNGRDAYVSHVTYRMGGFHMALDSYVILDGRHAYIISCTALKKAYDDYKPKFEEMVNTFSLE